MSKYLTDPLAPGFYVANRCTRIIVSGPWSNRPDADHDKAWRDDKWGDDDDLAVYVVPAASTAKGQS